MIDFINIVHGLLLNGLLCVFIKKLWGLKHLFNALNLECGNFEFWRTKTSTEGIWFNLMPQDLRHSREIRVCPVKDWTSTCEAMYQEQLYTFYRLGPPLHICTHSVWPVKSKNTEEQQCQHLQIVHLHISLQRILDPFCARCGTPSLKEKTIHLLQLGLEVKKPGGQCSS